MKYSTIKLHHHTFLPGFGSTDELEDVEASCHTHGVLAVKGPTGTVSIPWSAVSYAFEAETVQRFSFAAVAGPAAPEVEAAIIAGAVQVATIGVTRPMLTDAGVQAAMARANDRIMAEPAARELVAHRGTSMQPPPPAKRGGKR